MNQNQILDANPRDPKPCINCGTTHSFEFCPHCAQPYHQRSLTFKTLWLEFKERVIGLDGRFTRTFVMQFKNPGVVAHDFISGNRKKYMGPIAFYFIALTVYILLMNLFQLSPSDMFSGNAQIPEVKAQLGGDTDKIELYTIIGEQFTKYFKLISFFSVFLMGFLIWLFNLKMRLNLVEHMVFPLYHYGVIYLVSILQFPLINFGWLYIASAMVTLIQIGYFFYAYTTFDRRGSIWKRLLKALLIQIVNIIIIGFLGIVAVLIYMFTTHGFPETANP